MKKILIAALSLAVIAAIVLTVFIKIYITPERVKDYIVAAAEESLNRKVDVGKIDVNILKGITLKNFTIKEIDQETDFVKCKDFVLKFQLLPLLSRNLVIDELIITAPHVRIERDQKGRFNYEDIGEEDVPEDGTGGTGGTELPISLLVNRISISNIKLSLTDLKKELPDIRSTADVDISIKSLNGSELLSEGVVSITIDEAIMRASVNQKISNITSTLNYVLRADLESGVVSIDKADIKLQQVDFFVKGVLNQHKKSPEIDVSLRMPKVNSSHIRELAGFFADMKDIDMSGTVAADLKLKGEIAKPGSLNGAGYVSLDNGRFKYKKINSSIDGKLVFALESDNLHLDITEFRVDGMPLSIKGDVSKIRTSQDVDITFVLPEAKTEKVRSAIAQFAEMNDIGVSGTVSADAKLKGSLKKLDEIVIDANLVLNKAGVKYKDISSNLDADLKAAFSSDTLTINNAKLNVDGIPVSINGKIRRVRTTPELDISLHLPKANSGKLQAIAAPFARIEGLMLSGFLSADLKLQGMLKKPETMSAVGDMSLDKLGIKYDKVDALLDGKVRLDHQTMYIDVTGSSGRNSAGLKGSVRHLFKNQDINLNVYAKKLYLDEIVPASERVSTQKQGQQTPGAETPTGKHASPAIEAGPANLKLTAAGEVKVDEAVYKGLNMSNFYMKVAFRDNKLNVSKMNATAGKGEFSLNSLIDLSIAGYKYNLAGKIDSMYAEEIVNAFSPKAKGKIFGIITSNLKLSGMGTAPASVKKNLSGNADFNIRNGRITDAEIARKLSAFIDVGELETIKFSKAEGSVHISNGNAKLNSIFVSDELQMDPKGNIGLDESIDLAFDLKLSPDLTNKVRASIIRNNIRDEGGWGTVPLFVNGTISEPRYGVDVAKVGQKVINQEINKFLDKLINKDKKSEQPPPGEGMQTQEPKNPLEDILKQLPGLFQ